MKDFTLSEARQRLASVLERARKDGAVRIRKRDGQKFILQPERGSRSPLEVPGLNLNLNLNREELLEIIRSSRRDLPSRNRSTR